MLIQQFIYSRQLVISYLWTSYFVLHHRWTLNLEAHTESIKRASPIDDQYLKTEAVYACKTGKIRHGIPAYGFPCADIKEIDLSVCTDDAPICDQLLVN